MTQDVLTDEQKAASAKEIRQHFTQAESAPPSDFVTKIELNAVLQKVGTLQNKVDAFQTSGTPDQIDAVRKMVSDIPDKFVIKARKLTKDGKPLKSGEREEITLTIAHPSLFKLEMIAEEVDKISTELHDDLYSDMSIPNFVLKLLANKKVQGYFYKILQYAFDPLPDPTEGELSVPIEHLKLLDPARVIDTIIKRSTPFFISMLSTFQLGRKTETEPSRST